MLTVTDLAVDFGSRILFDNVTFSIKKKDKIGLAGRNGSGKSTLIKLIKGLESPTDGSISFPNGYTIGYLPQELQITSKLSVFDEARKALAEIEKVEAEYERINKEIQVRDDYESKAYLRLIDDLNHINIRLDALGSDKANERVEMVLKGLGFSDNDLSKPVNTFSGGWQMRVELAKLLLIRPDLLLLDEPTNHLDIESIVWLESFLQEYPSSILMVSHDKQFLDNITSRTIEIINGGIEDYRANYSKFVKLREERIEKQIQAKKNQDREIAQLKRNIDKFRYKKDKAKFAQTLIKRLERMERVEIDSFDTKTMTISFREAPAGGRMVLQGKNLGKAYGDNRVFEGLNFEVERGDRIAFVGKNGTGKSTLIKIIAEHLDHEGEIVHGHNIKMGYYAQHQNQTLNGDLTLLQTIETEAVGEMQGRERGILGAFMFSGDDVDKKVKVLSGGEKARLALARMLLEPINLLILDEPTNHLDILSKQVLKDALKSFKGTLIIVSHDRDFLAGLSNKVFEFKPNAIKEYLGDINEFLARNKVESLREFELNKKKESSDRKPSVSQNKLEYERKKELEKAVRKAERLVERIEKQIEEKEGKLAELNSKLQDAEYFKQVSADQNFFKEYEALQDDVKRLFQKWEQAQEELAALPRQVDI